MRGAWWVALGWLWVNVACAAGFPVVELRIADIRTAMLEDGVTCAAIMQSHLDRIARFDVALNSIIAVSPDAMAQARALDALPRAQQRQLALLCTPVLVKDNIDVRGMATTAGSRLLAANIAVQDAAAVAAVRRHGAIPLAKTNMSEFAFNYQGASAMGGRTRNPYDVRLSAGGSSSGNAAALAASFGVLALGTDTSGSLRVPAAVTGLVGLRPTHGAIDSAGVVPLSPSQDVVGPMCRTAADCVRLMQVLAPGAGQRLTSLSGVRIGLVRALLPGDDRSAPLVTVVNDLITQLRRLGVTVEDVDVDDVHALVGNVAPVGHTEKFASRSAFDFPAAFASYLHTRPGKADWTYANVESGLRQLNTQGLEGDRVIQDVMLFGENARHRDGDRRAVVNGQFRDQYVITRLNRALAGAPLSGKPFDFLMYPSVQGFNGSVYVGPKTGGTHRLSAYSGYPAVAFPAGWAKPADGQALQPVGVELLGHRDDDGKLLDFVRMLEEHLQGRVVPCLDQHH